MVHRKRGVPWEERGKSGSSHQQSQISDQSKSEDVGSTELQKADKEHSAFWRVGWV